MDDALDLSEVSITHADYRFLEIAMAGGFGADAVNKNRIRYANPGYLIHTSQPELSGTGVTFNLGLVNQDREPYAARLLAWALGEYRTLAAVLQNFGEVRSRLRNISFQGPPCMKWEETTLGRLDVAGEHALIDLLSKAHGRPGWQFVAEQSTDTLLNWIGGGRTDLFDSYVEWSKIEAMLREEESEKESRISSLLEGNLRFPTYRTLWSGWDLQKQLDHAREAINQDQCCGVKVKIGFGIEDDLERLRDVRKAIGPNAILCADANGFYSAADAISLASAMGESDIKLHFFEEPIHPSDLAGYSRLHHHVHQDEKGVRIAAGERDGTIWSALNMLPHLHHWQGDLSRFSLLDQVLIGCFLRNQVQQDEPSAWWTTHAGGTILNSLCVQSAVLMYALGLISEEDVKQRVLLEHISSYDELADPAPRWENGTYAAPNTPGIVGFSSKAAKHITATDGIWSGQTFDDLWYPANTV